MLFWNVTLPIALHRRKFDYAKHLCSKWHHHVASPFLPSDIPPPAFCKHNSKWILPLSSRLECEVLLEITLAYFLGWGWGITKWDRNMLKCWVSDCSPAPTSWCFQASQIARHSNSSCLLLASFHQTSTYLVKYKTTKKHTLGFYIDFNFWSYFALRPRSTSLWCFWGEEFLAWEVMVW